MKRLVILLVLVGLIFGVMAPRVNITEALPKKEYFNFVRIDQLLKDYFKALVTGNKEEILKYTAGEYSAFIKEGKIDSIIDSLKDFGKITFFGDSKIIPIEEEQVVEYRILVIYEKVHTVNKVWIKEFKEGPKVIGHSIAVFVPRNE
jgi:hypothetical protein